MSKDVYEVKLSLGTRYRTVQKMKHDILRSQPLNQVMYSRYYQGPVVHIEEEHWLKAIEKGMSIIESCLENDPKGDNLARRIEDATM